MGVSYPCKRIRRSASLELTSSPYHHGEGERLEQSIAGQHLYSLIQLACPAIISCSSVISISLRPQH